MKSVTLGLIQALTAAAVALPQAPASILGPSYPNTIVPGGVAPQTQIIPGGRYAPGSQRIKIRYGPYQLPAANATTIESILSGEKGTITAVATSMLKPCTSNCGLLSAQGGLEYANGTEANLDTGAWLHHVVMTATGTGHTDGTCGMPTERFFSSGNERTPTTFLDVVNHTAANKAAFPISPADVFSAELELMNLENEPKEVYYTVEYEYLPESALTGYKRSKALWLDVTGCGTSSVIPPAGKQEYTLKMSPWTSNVDGSLVGVAGHLHDGGVNVDVYVNNKNLCNSTANYGTGNAGYGNAASPAPVATTPSSSMGGMSGMSGVPPQRRQAKSSDASMQHIETMKFCFDLGPLKKGDKVWIDANYNYNQHMGMASTSGGEAEVMGIALLYVALDDVALF